MEREIGIKKTQTHYGSCILCKNELVVAISNAKATATNGEVYTFSLCRCQNCGHVQNKVDDAYLEATNSIYTKAYQANWSSKITMVDGLPINRDAVLVRSLVTRLCLNQFNGAALDVGAGNGSLLKSLRNELPCWDLAGFDVSNDKERLITSVPFCRFHSGSLDQIQDRFDLILFNHVVEHLTDPVAVLSSARRLLKENGRIIVIVPSFELVNTDLFFYEHCSHFTGRTLTVLASLAGLSVESDLDGCLGKIEIGFLAKSEMVTELIKLEQAQLWCEQLLKMVEDKRHRSFGIFGVGGGGMWLGPLFKEKVGFFVDDDPNKQGQVFAGCPVLSVEQIEAGSVVIVPFNNQLASISMAERLKARRPDVLFQTPSDLQS